MIENSGNSACQKIACYVNLWLLVMACYEIYVYN